MLKSGVGRGLSLKLHQDLRQGLGPGLHRFRGQNPQSLMVVGPSVISFCSKHKTKLVPEQCAAGESVIMAEETSSSAVNPVNDFPTADLRFDRSRSDEKPATLRLANSTMSLMDKQGWPKKNPTQKNPPKKAQSKKPKKNGFFWVFLKISQNHSKRG